VTNAGIHGLIANVKETTVIVKVADNVKIEMEKSAVNECFENGMTEIVRDVSHLRSTTAWQRLRST